MNLVWLAGDVARTAPHLAGGAEYRPTDASLAVLEGIEKDLAVAKARFATLMREDVPEFNRAMKGKAVTIADR
jgi:hypothetical protein